MPWRSSANQIFVNAGFFVLTCLMTSSLVFFKFLFSVLSGAVGNVMEEKGISHASNLSRSWVALSDYVPWWNVEISEECRVGKDGAIDFQSIDTSCS